jgi:hypothetical protein
MSPLREKRDENAEKVNAAVATILQLAAGATPTVLKDFGLAAAPDDGTVFAVTNELVIFAVHLTDRIAFGAMSERRDTFMDRLLPLVQSKLTPELRSSFLATYNIRQAFYGGFKKLVPDRAGILIGTLF